MYQALYRKYRPAVFDDVYGQEHITSVLKYEVETSRVSHAYLFCGSRGTGKTTCAKILAKAVNCENPENGNPCCKCDSCRSIDAGSAPDVLEMDAASNNGVDYIRDIRDAVSYTPAMLKKRVYIIDEVHMLSTSAFNALLKTLEEPPEHVVFVLATTELHKLPSTIISRCQRFDFRRIPQSVLCERLYYIAEKENIRLDTEAAQRIARQAQGGMRDAISLFELCGGGGSDVTLERVDEILGLSGYDQLSNAASALARGDMKAMFGIIAEAAASSKDIAVFWQELTSFYRDLMVVKYCDNPQDYLDLTEQELQLLRKTAELMHIKTLIYHSSHLDEAMISMQRMPQMKRTIAEFACLKMCDPQLDVSPEALSARIGQLEDKIAMLEMGGAVIPRAEIQPSPAEMQTESAEIPQTESSAAPEKRNESVQEEWQAIADPSEFLEKLAEIDKRSESFLDGAEILLSPDGTKAVIRVHNEFAARMLSVDSAKLSIARALMLCKISAGNPEVNVESIRETAETNPAADELYRNSF
ncbi:MAG: DNA polymerase III subunit gamma/tau [Ruminococcaceae bacterium]|nr:DNA polymerase III subunit gamma/tau [Oscillospiraceae bacterium]